MHFYKKILTVFFGLMLTTQVAFGDGENGCWTDQYIDTCDFSFITGSQSGSGLPIFTPYPNTTLTPFSIFYFFADITIRENTAGDTSTAGNDNSELGYLCWDFEEHKNNFDNLRKLFQTESNPETISCYKLNRNTLNFVLQTGTKPVDAEPTLISYNTYNPVAKKIKNACNASSVKCKKCDQSGETNGADYVGGTWTVFSTIADCHRWDEYDDKLHYDNRGTFKYSDESPCYYSGE